MKNILSYISNNSRFIINISVVILILVLLFSLKQCANNINTLEEYKKTLSLKDQQIQYWKDSAGRSHAKVQEIVASEEVIRTVYKKELDSIAHILDIKAKQIKEYISVITNSKGNGSGTLIIHDTVTKQTSDSVLIHDTTGYSLKVYDGYLNFNADINKNLTYTYQYSFIDSLGITKYYKKRGLFGLKKDYYVDVFSSNKNTTITGLKQFRISDIQKPKPFSLTVGAGASFINGAIRPTISATLGITIIRF
jgi:hypothetical protein